MNVTDCYRMLGLNSGASFEDIKSSYRRLARECHPDVSAGDQRTNDKFIELTTAYKFLLNTLTDSRSVTCKAVAGPRRSPTSSVTTSATQTSPSTNAGARGNSRVDSRRGHIKDDDGAPHKPIQIQTDPTLSHSENALKVSTYEQLQQLLKTQRLPRAIALVEGLARRLPQDTEVTQWQAIVYQQRGRQLLREHQPDKARLYLKKALRTDPHNRSLWAEVEKDFRTLEQLF